MIRYWALLAGVVAAGLAVSDTACALRRQASTPGTVSPCAEWTAKFERLPEVERVLLAQYGIVLAKDVATSFVLSPKLVPDCQVRLAFERYVNATVLGPPPDDQLRLFHRPIPQLWAHIERIARREEDPTTRRDRTATFQLRALVLLYTLWGRDVSSRLTPLRTAERTTDLERRTIDVVLGRMRAHQRVQWKDIEELCLDI
jgi:hypothetical protein